MPVGPAVRPNHGVSWMAIGTKRKDLVYVSTGDSVSVYEYAKDVVVGTLKDFTNARGSCTDAQGNVYVTNFNAADILEFSHGGTQPRYIIDPSPYPIDCSVDPTTGNLAVLNEYGKTEYSEGNVLVYTAAKGKPKVYRYPTLTTLSACGYDGNGDLIVSGYASRNLAFAYLPAKGRTLKPFSLPLSYGSEGPAYIRWDGKYLVVGFRNGNDGLIFVQYTVSGSSATQAGSMTMGLGDGDSGPFWVGRTGRSAKGHKANSLVVAVPNDGTYFLRYPGGKVLFELYRDSWGTGVTASHRL